MAKDLRAAIADTAAAGSAPPFAVPVAAPAAAFQALDAALDYVLAQLREADEPVMIGQVQLLDLPGDDLDGAARRVQAARAEVLALARRAGVRVNIETKLSPQAPRN